MKRYLAFSSEGLTADHYGKLIGDFDDLMMAKHAVSVRDREGWHVYLQGCVLDTQSGSVRHWDSTSDQFGFPRAAL